jgi:chemotaxis protein MotB
LAVSFLAAVLSTVGCCDKEKKLIEALNADNKKLLDTKTAMQSENASLKARQQDLLDQMDAKDAELLSANQKIANLEAQAATKPAEPAKSGEWDVGLHADRVSLTGDILFSSGRATLTAAGRATLNRVVATLRAKYVGMPVRVYGYTDSDPIRVTKKLWTDNLDLSANRAMAVARYLRSAGISADQIETIAMGESRPVASNSSRGGKAKNRRVEIVVIKK